MLTKDALCAEVIALGTLIQADTRNRFLIVRQSEEAIQLVVDPADLNALQSRGFDKACSLISHGGHYEAA